MIIRTLMPALALAGLLSTVAVPAMAMPGAAASITATKSTPTVEPVYWVWIHHHRYWRRHHYWHHY